MCVSCGCGEIHDNHGDPRHLTIEDLEQAAEAANLTVDQVVQNIQTSGRQGGSSPLVRQPGIRKARADKGEWIVMCVRGRRS
jgi:hypothetical protein